jgi:hypothetical protein
LESKRSVTSRWSDYFYRHLEPILKGNHIRWVTGTGRNRK